MIAHTTCTCMGACHTAHRTTVCSFDARFADAETPHIDPVYATTIIHISAHSTDTFINAMWHEEKIQGVIEQLTAAQ